MATTSPLHKVTDGDRWDAEFLLGRLGIVAHAAFLCAGFLSHGPPATKLLSLCRRYSLPQLVQRDSAIVLRLYRQGRRRGGGRSHMVLKAYDVTSYDDHYPELIRKRLDSAALAAVLSGGLDDTARELAAPDSTGQSLWKLLADGISRSLFLDVCYMNGVPVQPSFASLPLDIKVLILRRLDSGKDVAMAECASKELRDLAVEHNADIWKARCETREYISPVCGNWYCNRWKVKTEYECYEGPPDISWKQRYVRARQRTLVRQLERCFFSVCGAFAPTSGPDTVTAAERLEGNPVPEDQREPRNAAARGQGKAAAAAGYSSLKCNGYRRRHGAGAIHSPSSRYRWKHR